MDETSGDGGRGESKGRNNSITLVPASSLPSFQAQQTESQVIIAEAMTAIAQAISALPRAIENAVQTLVKGNGVNGILAGLAQHDGRKSLDARIMDQNALEIVEQLEKVFKKYNTRMRDLNRSDTLVDAEADYKKAEENQCYDTPPSTQEVSSQEQASPDPTKQS